MVAGIGESEIGDCMHRSIARPGHCINCMSSPAGETGTAGVVRPRDRQPSPNQARRATQNSLPQVFRLKFNFMLLKQHQEFIFERNLLVMFHLIFNILRNLNLV